MLRTITSRTKKIPSTGQGNVEWTLVTGDALDYNKLDYLNAENFIFSLDESNNSPYEVGTITGSQAYSFTGNIRLPLFLAGIFGMLAATAEEDIGKDGIYDDPVVDWSFYGTYSGEVFQVLPTVDILYTTKTIQKHDSVIREKKINEPCSLDFGDNQNPFSCEID
ncbi:MAG: hypothetical protein LBG59_05360 [Candidatus Peribacteria bacterium]|jgi:hypothetical protein|nr:hypothetical protein [Candidatus Peribacteria bacterium]